MTFGFAQRFSPISLLYNLLSSVANWNAGNIVLAIFISIFAIAIVAMAVSVNQARRKAEQLFVKFPNPSGLDRPNPQTMTLSIGSENGDALGGIDQGSAASPSGTNICGACGHHLEDYMCFNCGAKTCRTCGFANTGADLGTCAKCGKQM
jgi:hypothetical protein